MPLLEERDSKARGAMRVILGAMTGVAVWALVVTACDLAMRKSWVDYALVEKSLAFTLPMMMARLSESAACSLLSGFVSALVAKERIKSSLAAGMVLVALFLPVHISIGSRLPLWYHLTFFASLPVLSLAGGLLRPAGISKPVAGQTALPDR